MTGARGSVQRAVLAALTERPGEWIPRSTLTALVFPAVTPAALESTRRAIIALWRRLEIQAEIA